MDPSYSTIPEKANNIVARPPRARAIVEWIEGDVSRPPVVYPQAGSDELDQIMREAILERWAR